MIRAVSQPNFQVLGNSIPYGHKREKSGSRPMSSASTTIAHLPQLSDSHRGRWPHYGVKHHKHSKKSASTFSLADEPRSNKSALLRQRATNLQKEKSLNGASGFRPDPWKFRRRSELSQPITHNRTDPANDRLNYRYDATSSMNRNRPMPVHHNAFDYNPSRTFSPTDASSRAHYGGTNGLGRSRDNVYDFLGGSNNSISHRSLAHYRNEIPNYTADTSSSLLESLKLHDSVNKNPLKDFDPNSTKPSHSSYTSNLHNSYQSNPLHLQLENLENNNNSYFPTDEKFLPFSPSGFPVPGRLMSVDALNAKMEDTEAVDKIFGENEKEEDFGYINPALDLGDKKNNAATKIQRKYRNYRSKAQESELLNRMLQQNTPQASADEIKEFRRKNAARKIQREYREHLSSKRKQSRNKGGDIQKSTETKTSFPSLATHGDPVLEEFFMQDPRNSFSNHQTNLGHASGRSDTSLLIGYTTQTSQTQLESPILGIPRAYSSPSAALPLQSSYEHFKTPSSLSFKNWEDDEKNLLEFESQSVRQPSREISQSLINEFNNDVDSILNSTRKMSEDSSAKEIDEASMLISEKSDSQQESPRYRGEVLAEMSAVAAVPNNNLNAKNVSKTAHCLDRQSTEDVDRLSQVSLNESETFHKHRNSDKIEHILRQVLVEKQMLCDICEQLLQQVHLIRQKLFETEAKQEVSLSMLTYPIQRNKHTPKQSVAAVQTMETMNQNLDGLKLKLENAMEQMKLDHQIEISELREKYELVQKDTASELNTLKDQIASIHEKHYIAANGGVSRQNSRDNDTDSEEMKSRILYYSDATDKLESELIEKKNEIHVLKSQIDQVANEQSEMTTQFSAEFTKKLEDLETENQHLKRTLMKYES